MKQRFVNLINIHIDMHEPSPIGMSDSVKLANLAKWWHKWPQHVRENIIKEKCSGSFSINDGILGALLIGLEEVDISQLK